MNNMYLINKMMQYLYTLQYSLYENNYISSGSLQSMRYLCEVFFEEWANYLIVQWICLHRGRLFLWTTWFTTCTYIRNVKIVMHDLHCIHIWHLNLPCGFAEHFTTITWCVLVKSKQIVCMTHLIITWRNKWVCKIGKSPKKLWIFVCCI